MRLLEALASLFINFFGITQPTDTQRRRAAWFIFALLVGALVVIVAAATVLYHVIHR